MLRRFYSKTGSLLDGLHPDFFETLPSIDINVPQTIALMTIRTELDRYVDIGGDEAMEEISKDEGFLKHQLLFGGASGKKEELFTYHKRAPELQDKTREEVAQEREIFDDFKNTQPGLNPTNT
jgi:hypothetical protein